MPDDTTFETIDELEADNPERPRGMWADANRQWMAGDRQFNDDGATPAQED